MKDFQKIRSKFNYLNSPMESMHEDGSNFLINLTNSADLLLLDYQLMTNGRIKTGLDLYHELQLEKRAIIYTKSTSKEIEDIERKISNSGLNKRIFVLQKPLVYDNEAASILKDNIERILH